MLVLVLAASVSHRYEYEAAEAFCKDNSVSEPNLVAAFS